MQCFVFNFNQMTFNILYYLKTTIQISPCIDKKNKSEFIISFQGLNNSKQFDI